MDIGRLSTLVRDVPGFPVPEVTFKDITPVLADPDALRLVTELLAAPFEDSGVTVVAGIEARGFVLAPTVALALGSGFVPLRKPGKLPYHTRKEEYQLEYGLDALEIHVDGVGPDDRVLLVDDVIATGGTARAATNLIRGLDSELVGMGVLIELTFLGGRETLDGVDLHSILTYDS
ncbi:MAG: adenine phosphoribosyltransferase [bacterium]|nr:adenine phosphoribosyltransferase [bacterium]MDE0351755.1 adenine phosphoribosyltransferase [bacterium]